MSVKALLKKAKALIVKYGWVQFKLGSKDDGFCAVGAMYHAAGGQRASRRSYNAFTSALGTFEWAAARGMNVATWNNKPSRRKSQVLAGFDKAIKATK